MTIYLHTHHKCASRWAIAYFAKAAELSGKKFHTTDYGDEVAPHDADLVLFGNSDPVRARAVGLGGVHFVRNPLNLLVSAYHSHLQTHPTDGWPELVAQRELLRGCTYEEGLFITLVFLERSDIKKRAHGPFFDLRHWDVDDSRFSTVRVEDLTSEPSRVMGALLPGWQLPSDEDFEFKHFAGGRLPGQLDDTSHYRSGAHGQWQTAAIPPAIHGYVARLLQPLVERHYPELLQPGTAHVRPFYDRAEAERIQLTRQAMASRRSLRERWTALARPEADAWEGRASRAGAWLEGHAAVVDLGCGTMLLERHLAPGVRYHPVDIVRRDQRTTVCDLNGAPAPSFDASAVACLGLLEYLFDPAAVLRQLAAAYTVCVISYCPTDAPSPLMPRRAHGWVNDYSKAGIEAVFLQAAWRVVACEALDGVQFLWRLQAQQP
jgi:hypothetical protein